MTTPQQEADALLARWQSMRGLSPREKMEMLFFDFLLPPPTPVEEYEATIHAINEIMSVA